MNPALELFDEHPMLVNVVLVVAVCFVACLIGALVLHLATRCFERKARRAREREAARTEPL